MFPVRQGIALTPSVSLQRVYGLLSRRIIIEPTPFPPPPPAPPVPDIAIRAIGFNCPLTSAKKMDSRLQLRKNPTMRVFNLKSQFPFWFLENQKYFITGLCSCIFFFWPRHTLTWMKLDYVRWKQIWGKSSEHFNAIQKIKRNKCNRYLHK